MSTLSRFAKPCAIVSLLSALVSAAAAVVFQMTGGVFGILAHNYYNILWVIMLFGAVVLVALFTLLNRHGLAALSATALPGLVLCGFMIGFDKRGAYWHFVDLEEPHLDTNMMAFIILLVVAFIIGEIAIYVRKPGQVKAKRG